MLDLAASAGLPTAIGDYSLTQLYCADEMFVTGTMGGLTPVLALDGRPIGDGKPGPVTARLARAVCAAHRHAAARRSADQVKPVRTGTGPPACIPARSRAAARGHNDRMSTPRDVPAVALPGGGRMPQIGFGTWKLRHDQARDAVLTALAAGYRHIDTATMYANEAEIGQALAAQRRGSRRVCS